MKLLSASLKLIGRTLNDVKLARNLEKAKATAYSQTHKDMVQARRKGKYINGKEKYRQHYRNNVRIATSKHSNYDKFISDL